MNDTRPYAYGTLGKGFHGGYYEQDAYGPFCSGCDEYVTDDEVAADTHRYCREDFHAGQETGAGAMV